MVKSVFDCSLSGVETNFFFNRNMTEKCRKLLALVSDCFGCVFIVSIHIPDRWQSKTLMLSTNVDQIPSETETVRNRLFGLQFVCLTGDKWKILAICDPRSSIVQSLLDCRLSDVIKKRIL